MMQQLQKSLALITPILQIQDHRFYTELKNSYLGNLEYEGEITWGNFLYLEFKSTSPQDLLTKLRSHRWYEDEIHKDDEILLVYKIPKKEKKNIVQPFLEGKYSEIDRDYVEKNFKFYTNNKISINYRICTKDEGIRQYWEKKIGMSLPEDAEVWSKPKETAEIYGYEKFLAESAELIH